MPPQHHAGVWLASGMLLFFLVRRVAGLQRRQIAMCHGTAAGEAARPLSKVHHATVALVPPEECWPPIQEARLELRDRGIYRWPPHINLLYAVAPADEMALALARLAPAGARASARQTPQSSTGRRTVPSRPWLSGLKLSGVPWLRSLDGIPRDPRRDFFGTLGIPRDPTRE